MVRMASIAATLSLCATTVFAQPGAEIADAQPSTSKHWQRAWTMNADRQMQLLTAAYGLNETVQKDVRKELESRLARQAAFEQSEKAKLRAMVDIVKGLRAKGAALETPGLVSKARAMEAKLKEMPLDEEQVARWLEERLPPEVVQRGRPRLIELWYRRDQRLAMSDQDKGRRVGMKRTMAQGRKLRQAPLSSDGNPMPHGGKADPAGEQAARDYAKRIVRPNRGARGRVESPGPGAVSQPPPGPVPAAKPAVPFVPYPIAPPLDEWDKYVASVAKKYGFTDAQVTKARSILRALRRRAFQYQMSRSADFAKAELISDRKARKERLAELNVPLGALFSELKQRLEALPTSEQRQRAGRPKEKQG